ncbi:MAG: glycine--tRNA ligase subunit alpha [Candidatus Carsonella ruddii]
MENSIILQTVMYKYIIYYWKKKKFKYLYIDDSKSGAATYNYRNIKFLKSYIFFKIYFIQNCYRQFDSFFLKNYKLLIHRQIQIICKPIPFNFINIYKESFFFKKNINFKKDDWKSPLLGAKGIGYESLLNNIEISQITLFIMLANIKLYKPIIEITYGLERINNKKINFIKEKFFSINYIFYKFSIKKIIFLYYQCFLNYKKKNFLIAYLFLLKLTNNFNLIDNYYLSNNFNRIKIILILNLLSYNIIKKI